MHADCHIMLYMLAVLAQVDLIGKGSNGVQVAARFGTDSGDCGYKATSIMIAEVGITLAVTPAEAFPVAGGGILTTACLGMPLIERLRAAGITCRVQDVAIDSLVTSPLCSKKKQ
jgi:short subunit dehydrogenase-like uncharacterized protein